MHIIFQQELGNGKVHFYADESWDQLKFKLTKEDSFPLGEWEAANYAWDALRQGEHIISDGACLWQYLNVEGGFETVTGHLFEGSLVMLSKIDPIFDGEN
jgi:hypothetical protein